MRVVIKALVKREVSENLDLNPTTFYFVRISQGICSLSVYREKDFCSVARHRVVDLFFVPEAAD